MSHAIPRYPPWAGFGVSIRTAGCHASRSRYFVGETSSSVPEGRGVRKTKSLLRANRGVYIAGVGMPEWKPRRRPFHAPYGGVTNAQVHRRRRRQLPALDCSCPGNGPVALAHIPWRFRQGPCSLRRRSPREHGALRRRFDPLCLALRSLFSRPRRSACPLVLYHRRSDGHRRDYSQLEQGLAALVLVVLAADLAGELLDRPAACRAP